MTLYVSQMFDARHQRQPQLDATLGCRFGAVGLSDPQALLPAINALSLDFTWKEVEPAEASYCWEPYEALLKRGLELGVALQAGPLIDFSFVLPAMSRRSASVCSRRNRRGRSRRRSGVLIARRLGRGSAAANKHPALPRSTPTPTLPQSTGEGVRRGYPKHRGGRQTRLPKTPGRESDAAIPKHRRGSREPLSGTWEEEPEPPTPRYEDEPRALILTKI